MPISAAPPSTHGSFLMPSLEHARVADAMHPGVLRCDSEATLTEVARLMTNHHVHCVAVGAARGADGERLGWGIVTDRDVLHAGLEGGGEALARELASHSFVTVAPDTPLRDAGELMLTRKVSHLLVVDPLSQRPMGILSTLDVAGVIAWGEC